MRSISSTVELLQRRQQNTEVMQIRAKYTMAHEGLRQIKGYKGPRGLSIHIIRDERIHLIQPSTSVSDAQQACRFSIVLQLASDASAVVMVWQSGSSVLLFFTVSFSQIR